MGYTTDFDGAVLIEPPLNAAEIEYLRKFSGTRRMDREGGPYFVDGSGSFGQGSDPDIRDHNRPPAGQPGLWCQWVPTDDGRYLEWDGREKFYDSIEWMQYLIDHFLKPNAEAFKVVTQLGSVPLEYATTQDLALYERFNQFTFDHILNGVIDAQGEDPEDRWRLVVENNIVTEQRAKIVWE